MNYWKFFPNKQTPLFCFLFKFTYSKNLIRASPKKKSTFPYSSWICEPHSMMKKTISFISRCPNFVSFNLPFPLVRPNLVKRCPLNHLPKLRETIILPLLFQFESLLRIVQTHSEITQKLPGQSRYKQKQKTVKCNVTNTPQNLWK